MKPSETTHVIHHGNCYDGFGAAWAAWIALGANATYLPALYGAPMPDVPSDANVVMVDISYKRADMLALKERVNSLVVLDHHKTAEAELAGLSFAHFDMEHSGAYLSWVYFNRGAMPTFIRYIEDNDLWRHKLVNSHEFAAALASYPFDFQVWTELAFGTSLSRLFEEGKILVRAKAQMVEQMCKHHIFAIIGGERVPVVNATMHFSDVGHYLAEKYPECPFAAYYLDRSDGKRQWGLRRRDGSTYDVSRIAKLYGGGGHPGAAGFETPWDTFPFPPFAEQH